MKSNWVNNTRVEGYVFSHTLEKRVTGAQSKNPGQEYIRGTINVATDAAATNVIGVNFTYVTPFYKSGNENATYATLADIIEKGKTYEQCGKEATKVRIDGNVGLNEFVTRDGDMAMPKQFDGSFVHFSSARIEENKPATFETDMLISNVVLREVENGDDYMNVNGYVFNFRGDILPVTYTIRTKEGIQYFEDQDISASNPLLTKVWGEIVCTTVETRHETESAFGAPTVNVSSRTLRAWDIIGASAEPMEFDDESTITKSELKAKLAAREEYLAGIRKRHEEYQASQSGGAAFAAPASKVAEVTVDDNFVF